MSLLFFLSSHSSVLPEDKSYTHKVLISALSLFIISESEQACLGIFTPFPADAIVSQREGKTKSGHLVQGVLTTVGK